MSETNAVVKKADGLTARDDVAVVFVSGRPRRIFIYGLSTKAQATLRLTLRQGEETDGLNSRRETLVVDGQKVEGWTLSVKRSGPALLAGQQLGLPLGEPASIS